MCVCEPVIEFLQQIGSQPRARPPSNGMTQDESLQRQSVTRYSLFRFTATACATCEFKTHCKFHWCRGLKVCGWPNASLPQQLYKWEQPHLTNRLPYTPQDSPVIPAFHTRPAIITRHSTCHTLPTYTCSRQPGPPSYPMHTWVHTLNNNVGS